MGYYTTKAIKPLLRNVILKLVMSRTRPPPDPHTLARVYAGYNALVAEGLLPAGLTNIEMRRSDRYVHRLAVGNDTTANGNIGLAANGDIRFSGIDIRNNTLIRGVDANGIYHHFLIARKTPLPGNQIASYTMVHLRTTSDFTNTLSENYPQPENARLVAGRVYEAIGTSLAAEEARKPILATRKPTFAPN